MKKKTPDLKSIVAKDNELIGRMAKFKLSELRLIAFCLAHYDSRSPENMRFDATVSELQDIFPMDDKSAYGVIRNTVIGLGSKPLEIKEGNARHLWNWFSGFTYYESEGRFTFKINPDLQSRLLGLKGQFTRYRLEDVYQFRAASTWKMYELLKKWDGAGSWQVELDELRLFLGVAGKYPRWSDLQARIITPATKEINKLSDIRIEVTKLKRGRTITGLQFTISRTGKQQADIEVPAIEQQIKVVLTSCGLHHKTISSIMLKATEEGREHDLLRKCEALQSKHGKNPKAVTGSLNIFMKSWRQGILPGMDMPREKATLTANDSAIEEYRKYATESLKSLATSGNMYAQQVLSERQE